MPNNMVIVAIPEQTDEVWKISSEKIPHMTLLFLGDAGQVENVNSILGFVEHAAALLPPFYMEMDYRGVLGPDEADVIFFEKGWDFKQIAQFREQLLANKAIRSAYNSTTQYDEWTPHLTLGYPATPAKETDRNIYSIRFDRIAVWTGDFSGPEFRLKHPDMSDMADNAWPSMSMSADDAKSLYHYGVKGMKWGHRKDSSGSSDRALKPTPGGFKGRVEAVRNFRSGNKPTPAPKPVVAMPGHTAKGKAAIKTEGGTHQPAHPDAIKAATTKQQLHASGIKSLSNKELQDLASRLDLEARVNRLEPPQHTFTQKAVAKIMNDPVKTLNETNKAVDNGKKLVKLAQAKKAVAA